MLNKNQKLNKKLFDKDVEKELIRNGFGDGLLEAGEKNKNVVVLTADLRESVKIDKFVEKFPERFFEVGIAEQNLVSVASGMASVGKIPFATSYAIFSPGRNWEQIRTNICYNNTNVKIIRSHAGLSVGPDGGSDQALEDIALMRVLPRMQIVVPCDSIEAKKATIAMVKTDGPQYLRLIREKSPLITTEDSPFEIGKANILFESENPQVLIISCGPIIYNALISAKKLEEEGIGSIVLNLHTIKPIDREKIIELAKKTNAVVTIEDHQIAGGLGSAVAEVLAENFPIPIRFIGIKDEFGQSGNPEELYKHYGLDSESITETIKKFLGK